MSAATLIDIAPAASQRLLTDVITHGSERDREPAFDRLQAALGREFAERLVAALSQEALDRLEAALSRDFADRIAAAVADERAAARARETSARDTT
jgi:hypothetical protein